MRVSFQLDTAAKNELRVQIKMKGKTILNDVFGLQYFC